MARKLQGSVRLKRTSRHNTKEKDVIYNIGDKNAKGRSQETHAVTGKVGMLYTVSKNKTGS